LTRHTLRITAPPGRLGGGFNGARAEVVDGQWGEVDPVLLWFKTSSMLTPREAVKWMREKGWRVEIEEVKG
jgi:hypothetical protein